MMKPVSLSHVVRRLKKRTTISDLLTSRSSKRAGLFLAVSLFLISMLFSACSGLFGGGAKPTPTSSTRVLSKISWCDKPLMVFRDEGYFTPTPAVTAQASATTTPSATASATGTPSATSTPTVGFGTPQTLTSWSEVETHLGFTVFLPTTLPNGTCLVSAQATIHDSIFGSSFTIGYLLPDHTSLSVSEAPLLSQSPTFQCSATPVPTSGGNKGTVTTKTPNSSPTAVPTPVCSGAKKTTSIVISGPGSVAQVQQIFTNLQPNVDWIPAS